jgi:hypothetical protein
MTPRERSIHSAGFGALSSLPGQDATNYYAPVSHDLAPRITLPSDDVISERADIVLSIVGMSFKARTADYGSAYLGFESLPPSDCSLGLGPF